MKETKETSKERGHKPIKYRYYNIDVDILSHRRVRSLFYMLFRHEHLAVNKTVKYCPSGD